ncbi:unnamed protein product [Protopolystoma xenopodis]|uniref:Uncharacterized protein n=1 Tax=Protopolystoma xenopodis TaxID=117903 RepID=A0A3S5CD38_9PLAT|nr:unnamed protein product [Protopolystoma xenopodis]
MTLANIVIFFLSQAGKDTAVTQQDAHTTTEPIFSSLAEASQTLEPTYSDQQTDTLALSQHDYVSVGLDPITESDDASIPSDKRPLFLPIPIPVPIYVPLPVYMYARPTPFLMPFPLPLPIPLVIKPTCTTELREEHDPDVIRALEASIESNKSEKLVDFYIIVNSLPGLFQNTANNMVDRDEYEFTMNVTSPLWTDDIHYWAAEW